MWPQFTIDPTARIARQEDHLANVPRYPDKHFYLQETQKYFFRSEQLRHLRPAQFLRYFSHHDNESEQAAWGGQTNENTIVPDETLAADDPAHRNYDQRSSDAPAAGAFKCARFNIASPFARRRKNSALAVPRTRFLEPLSLIHI